VKRYAIEAETAVEADVEAAFDWYEGEEPGLGFEFLEELRAAYHRILDHPTGSARGARVSIKPGAQAPGSKPPVKIKPAKRAMASRHAKNIT
jgi:hypothetical protein